MRRSLAIFATAGAALFAQDAAHPTFEVASIKLVAPGAGRGAGRGGRAGVRIDPGRFSFRSTLTGLVMTAYGVDGYQVSGGPGWVVTDIYDVQATTSTATTKEQMLVMLQNLLADRFQLKLRRESKTIEAFVLEVAKGGPKFRELKEGETSDRKPDYPDEPRFHDIKTLSNMVRMMMNMSPENTVMSDGSKTPAEMLAGVPARTPTPLVDKTGLTGSYDILLNMKSASEDDLPGFMKKALEDQLGLKVSPRRVAVEMLVIDHAEKPSGN